MDTTSYILLTTAVVGTVQVIKHTFGDNRITGFYTIVCAILIGILAGAYHVQGLQNIGYGVLVALGSIGVSTIADRFGTTTNVTASTTTTK